MITQINFSVPFQQEPIVNYIATNIPDLFQNKLVKVSNISPIQAGICRGLSTCFLLHENNNRGTQYIEKINESFDTLAHYEEPQNTLDEYLLNFIKNVKLSEFNVLMHQAVNEQIDYSNTIALDNLLFDIKNLTLREISAQEENIVYLANLLQLPEITKILSDPDKFIIGYDSLANLVFFIKKILDRNGSSCLHLSQEEIAPIREKLSYRMPLTTDDAHLILIAFLKFELDRMGLISVDRQIRAGLIDDNTQPLENRQNINHYGELKTLADIEMDIDESIKSKGYYYSLVETIGHCMAISAKSNNKKVVYTFFDPNNGILFDEDSYRFFKQLSQFFNEFSTNAQTEHSYAGHALLNVRIIDKRANSQNKLSLPEFSDEDIQTNIKNALIKNKANIVLPNNFKIKLKSHDLISNITKITIYKGLKKWNLDSNETDVKKMISTITENLPLIKNTKGNLSIDKYGEIHNR
ncbi:hypothetical protein [Providencia sp. wls1916]|uniref:hypothetical protein n=1 Tax=Providencia sp. wls1916 TaxID=2675155 RepID=UPI0012B62FBA|nr:hypothetical protein [Providencia sp. wls1916]MTC76681.1 hypothetical protein [Providencia sp. wls1916]